MFLKSKFSKLALASAFAGVAMFSTQSANAIDATATLNVSATVQTACAFGTVSAPVASYNMAFGVFSLGSGVDKTASTSVVVECASATTYTLAADGTVGSRVMAGPGIPTLKYELYRDVGNTLALGATVGVNTIDSAGATTGGTHTIFGKIPQAGNTGVIPGSYTDVVTLTLTF
jgi:spore coat protein U-like protein